MFTQQSRLLCYLWSYSPLYGSTTRQNNASEIPRWKPIVIIQFIHLGLALYWHYIQSPLWLPLDIYWLMIDIPRRIVFSFVRLSAWILGTIPPSFFLTSPVCLVTYRPTLYYYARQSSYLIYITWWWSCSSYRPKRWLDILSLTMHLPMTTYLNLWKCRPTRKPLFRRLTYPHFRRTRCEFF